jgi:predicted amidophosphoribosyltransferase
MKCENCGFELTDTAKFCPECGRKVERKPQFNLGEKNVIAGDVYGSKEDIHISGNATFIEDGDETKKAATCSNCGRHVLLLNGYTCRECGKFVCSGCYSKAFKVCLDCAKKIEKAESKARTIMLNLESFIKNQAANYESEEDFL